MPEGDALHRVAASLQVLVGHRVEAEAPHPRAAAGRVAERIDGRVLERAEAVGKNLLLAFEGGLLVRSHLRMKGRWRVGARGRVASGRPWLVLRAGEHEAALWHGPVLELVRGDRTPRSLGPDILAEPPDLDAMVAGLRAAGPARELGDALLDQRLVAGIGNLWKAECLWEARLSPWLPLADVEDAELRLALTSAHRLMAVSVAGPRPGRRVYRRSGRPCPRCGTPIRSRSQGEHARIAYWCPGCQETGPDD